ncbi:MAG TPA: VOC family protein [Bryobacteraceae bacterium]|jgi:PhnB protein
MPGKVQPIPKGYHSLTPYLVVNDARKAIEFYQRAFGAQQITKMDGPEGKIMHAEIKIGDSMLMLADEMGGSGARSPKSLGGTTTGIMLYVDNVDTTFKQAISAGAKADQQPADMFWGDRYGKITDPFGHSWSLATHTEDVAPQEMAKRMKEEMAKMGQRQAQPVS